MQDYKQTLEHQPILTAKIITLVTALQDKSLTKGQFHNRKAYAKRTGNLLTLLEYTIAFEIANLGGVDE